MSRSSREEMLGNQHLFGLGSKITTGKNQAAANFSHRLFAPSVKFSASQTLFKTQQGYYMSFRSAF